MIWSLFSTRPDWALIRLTMAVMGSPGARRGMIKIRVMPSQTVSRNMPKRLIKYSFVRPPIVTPF